MHPNFSFDAKKIWKNYNVRGAVLLSLFFQVLLVLIGPKRKRTKTGSETVLIWGSYLLADWVAGFAIGLISSGEGTKYLIDEDLAAFWAPFLLVHLGGQDTVTAFSLEDNQLWPRRLLELIFHLGLVGYAFYQTLPNRFWLSTILMFCAGTIKYAERTRALYLACLSNFKAHLLPKPDAGPNYAHIMEDLKLHRGTGIPAEFQIKKELTESKLKYSGGEPINEIDVVKMGYKFYRTFRGLMVELVFSLHERNESREFFFKRTWKDAFCVMEVELNFMYDVFYTKMNVVRKKIGYAFRLFCDVLIMISFCRFITLHKHVLQPTDKAVCYTLFAGAIGLDLIALARSIFSDWTLAWVENHRALSFLYGVRKWIPFDNSRWSNSMSQFNLIGFCLEVQTVWLYKGADFFGTTDLLDEYLHKTHCVVDDKLKEFIFKNLVEKATEAESVEIAKEIWSSKGKRIFSKLLKTLSVKDQTKEDLCEIKNPGDEVSDSVSDKVEFDESLLRWHIATELCYSKDDELTLVESTRNCRDISRLLSDYMLYLLVIKRSMMSAVAGLGQIRFADTCAEAKRFFQQGGDSAILKQENCFQSFLKIINNIRPDKAKMKQRACKKLLSVDVSVKPCEIKGDRCQSLLFDGCRLAKSLLMVDISQRWEIISKVWVELLAYAATHIRPDAHGQQLSKGGELLTFVWLLMAHFGLGEQFRIQAGTSRAKLRVGSGVIKRQTEKTEPNQTDQMPNPVGSVI